MQFEIKLYSLKLFTWTYDILKVLNVEVISRKLDNGEKNHIHLNNELYIYIYILNKMKQYFGASYRADKEQML